jgi:hypothetical protein
MNTEIDEKLRELLEGIRHNEELMGRKDMVSDSKANQALSLLPKPCEDTAYQPAGEIEALVKDMQEFFSDFRNDIQTRARQYGIKACTHLTSLLKRCEQLNKRIIEYEETEALVCPEDVGIKEYVAALQAKVEQFEAENRKLKNQKEYVYKPEIVALKAMVERLEGEVCNDVKCPNRQKGE